MGKTKGKSDAEARRLIALDSALQIEEIFTALRLFSEVDLSQEKVEDRTSFSLDPAILRIVAARGEKLSAVIAKALDDDIETVDNLRRCFMAKREPKSTAAEPRTPSSFGLIESTSWRDLPVYKGTLAQLIASGLLTREQIPGEPGCPRVRAFRFNLEDGREYRVTVARKTRLVSLITLRPNDEEQKVIEAAEESEREERRAAQEAQYEATHGAERRRARWRSVATMRDAIAEEVREQVIDAIRAERRDGKGAGLALIDARYAIAKIQLETARSDRVMGFRFYRRIPIAPGSRSTRQPGAMS